MQKRLTQMCAEVDQAIEDGAEFIVLSDRDSNKDLAPIPSLLMLAAVHHHLIRNQTRMKCGLVVEAGDVREVHHIATLIGYGASAVNPYLAMETVEYLVRAGFITGIAPVEKRLTIDATDSTSSIGTGVRPSVLSANRPRSDFSSFAWSSTSFVYSRKTS